MHGRCGVTVSNSAFLAGAHGQDAGVAQGPCPWPRRSRSRDRALTLCWRPQLARHMTCVQQFSQGQGAAHKAADCLVLQHPRGVPKTAAQRGRHVDAARRAAAGRSCGLLLSAARAAAAPAAPPSCTPAATPAALPAVALALAPAPAAASAVAPAVAPAPAPAAALAEEPAVCAWRWQHLLRAAAPQVAPLGAASAAPAAGAVPATATWRGVCRFTAGAGVAPGLPRAPTAGGAAPPLRCARSAAAVAAPRCRLRPLAGRAVGRGGHVHVGGTHQTVEAQVHVVAALPCGRSMQQGPQERAQETEQAGLPLRGGTGILLEQLRLVPPYLRRWSGGRRAGMCSGMNTSVLPPSLSPSCQLLIRITPDAVSLPHLPH